MYNLFVFAVMLFMSLPAWSVGDNSIEIKDGSPPQVNAEIVQIKVSPDQSLVALELADAKDQHGVVIFDLENRKVKAIVSDVSGDFLWSKDSKNLAVLDEPKAAWDINRNGDKSRVKIAGMFYDFTWREDKADSYFYRDDDFVVHGNLESGDTSKAKMPHTIQALFNVNGKPCCSYTVRDGNNWDDKTVMYAMEVDSKKQMLAVPLYKEAGIWDMPIMKVSPDGKYFSANAWVSASTLTMVARVADAADVYKYSHKAIMYQEDTDNEYPVTWLTGVSGYMDHDLALVYPPFGGFFVLDLFNGSRNYPRLYERFEDLAELWKPENGGTSMKDWIYITKRGLEAYIDKKDNKPVLLLRHKPNPKKDE